MVCNHLTPIVNMWHIGRERLLTEIGCKMLQRHSEESATSIYGVTVFNCKHSEIRKLGHGGMTLKVGSKNI